MHEFLTLYEALEDHHKPAEKEHLSADMFKEMIERDREANGTIN